MVMVIVRNVVYRTSILSRGQFSSLSVKSTVKSSRVGTLVDGTKLTDSHNSA